MTTLLKFIENHSYDFNDKNTGERVQGIYCSAFDPDAKRIVKVKTKHLLDNQFGDDLTVNVVLSGRYVDYEVAE